MVQAPMQIKLDAHPDFTKGYERFYESYDVSKIIMPGDWAYRKTNLQPAKERVCRFCGAANAPKKFKDAAHLIPESIGNKDLFSGVECVVCNHLLGKFDNDLAPYMGIVRTMGSIKTKKGVPTFKSKGNTLTARSGVILNEETVVITRASADDDTIQSDNKTGTTKVKYTKQPYTPLNVYKALLKIALSIVDPASIIADYKISIDYLMGRSGLLLQGGLVSGYKLPVSFNLPPHVMLFKKKNASLAMHTHVMALYAQNLIMALPVPLNVQDNFFLGKEVQLPLYPPLFTQFTDTTTFGLEPFRADFSSCQNVVDEQDSFILQMSPADLANSVAYDIVSGTFTSTPYNPPDIMKIIIRRGTGSIDPARLHQEIQQL